MKYLVPAVLILSAIFALPLAAQNPQEGTNTTLCEGAQFNDYWFYMQTMCNRYGVCGLGVGCPINDINGDQDELDGDYPYWPPVYPAPRDMTLSFYDQVFGTDPEL